MNGVHFKNGKWLEADKLTISAFDLGFSRGLAVFDVMRTYNAEIFHLDRHLARFREASKTLDFKLSYSDDQISQIIKEGIAKNSFSEAVVRLNLTAGINEGLLSSSNPTFIAMFLPLSLPSPKKYVKGQSLTTILASRTLPEVKTTNYVAAKLGLMKAALSGHDEALYVDVKERVLETTISNVFFWQGDKLVTPREGAILPGITRSVVLDVAGNNQIDIEERDVYLNELDKFEEAFACSSIKEILAINTIDKHVFGSGKIGSKTKNFSQLYKKYVTSYYKNR